MKWFDDVIKESASKYPFIMGLADVQELNDDDE